MIVTKKSIPRRPQGLRARPQMAMTAEEFSASCERIGLSLKEIAERLALNRATIHGYLNGRLKVTTVVSLAMVTLEHLVEAERAANRKKLARYGYSATQVEELEMLPSALEMGLVLPEK